MWERGVHATWLRGQPGAGLLLATGLVAVVLVTALTAFVVLVAGGSPRAVPTVSLGASAQASETRTPEPEPAPAGGQRSYTLDGTDPEAFPEDFTGLAFVTLDDPLESVQSELGPPQERQPDINATTANTWRLAGGAEFVAVTVGSEPGDEVVALAADVPPGSDVRLAAHEGVVIGRSTPAEIAAAWGADHERSIDPADDFVLRYVRCTGGWPVVVKFDQAGERSWDSRPVDRVLIAYADEDPATACPRA